MGRRCWQVREIVCDPFRWTRTIQALEAEGLPVVEFPQSPQRMTPATTRLYEAVVNGQVTQSGDTRLARHVGDAAVKEDARGTRLAKQHKHSARRIDLAVAAVMAHARACELATSRLTDDLHLREDAASNSPPGKLGRARRRGPLTSFHPQTRLRRETTEPLPGSPAGAL